AARRTESGSPLAETTRQFVSGTRPEAKRQPAWKATRGPSGAFASKTDLTSYRGVTMVPFASGTSPVFYAENRLADDGLLDHKARIAVRAALPLKKIDAQTARQACIDRP